MSTSWERSAGRFAFQAEIPPNVAASVHVPSARAADVRDAAGNPPASIGSFPGLAGAEEAVFIVGSGNHEFTGPALADPGHSS